MAELFKLLLPIQSISTSFGFSVFLDGLRLYDDRDIVPGALNNDIAPFTAEFCLSINFVNYDSYFLDLDLFLEMLSFKLSKFE